MIGLSILKKVEAQSDILIGYGGCIKTLPHANNLKSLQCYHDYKFSLGFALAIQRFLTNYRSKFP